LALTPPPIQGLTSTQVAERVARGESNAFKARVGRSYWDIARDNIFNLFNIVLFSLLVIVLFFGDYATVLFAGFSVVTNSLLGMYQEIAAKRKLDKLAALAAADIKVYRDGKLTHVPMHNLVKDDVIPVEPGDRLVVDGRVQHSDAMEMDESQLTGESDAVMKEGGAPVYSGSFCVAGSGVIVATHVGRDSTINKLSTVAKAYKNVLTPTQQRITLIVQLAIVIMAICTPMIFIAGYQNNANIFNLGTFRNAVVFVTSLVPQGLVLTATLSLTIGALVISRYQTLVQRVNAVESMANVTVLCFDKTGTLTRNKLTVKEVLPLNGASETDLQSKLQTYLGNLAHLNRTAAAVAQHYNGDVPLLPAVRKEREIPFTSARKWGAVVLRDETLVMGAPERVLCPENVATAERAAALSRQGLRVLAFGRFTGGMTDGKLPDDREDLALIVLSDEIREDIGATLDEFRAQNVRLKVISGDNLETVSEIAGEAGMKVRHAYTGDQLEAMGESEFESAAMNGDVFARIEPDTKRKIIAALKKHGEYVAMVGDGVNDVPALKEANLAVVMNDGAQISKDIGDIVLLNNAMSTLPRAFFEGRTITQTIFGTSKIFLVKNFYSMLFFIFAGFMAMPFPINPIQISWVTFGIINVPATLIAFRVLRPAYMKEFRRDVLDYVVTAGFIGSAAMAFLYAFTYLSNNQDVLESRSTMMLFITLYGVLVLWHTHGLDLFEPRTIWKYKRLFFIGIALAAATIIVPYLLPSMFEYVAPNPLEWGLVIIIFLISLVILRVAMKTRGLVGRIWRLTEP
jgi:cation-transporting P-type ATPase E